MKNQINKYSNALFNVAKKGGQLDKISAELENIKYLYRKEPTFKLLFETKRINQKIKKNIIKNILVNFDSFISELLYILIDNKDSKILINIIDKFQNLSKKEHSTSEIEIITSAKLDDTTQQFLSQKLNCNLKATVDASMIGGLRLRQGNKIFDNSISYQLKQLKKTLYNLQ